MDDDRLWQKNRSDNFSFPNVSIQTHQEFEFEFGSVTPGSPNSPADHLFSDGKLLPHSFPVIQPRNSTSFSRSMTRTSSISSKDSFLSSRSNSTNSSCSSSSARTSVSTDSSSSSSSSSFSSSSSSERKTRPSDQGKDAKRIAGKRERPAILTSQQYGSSQRWQFIAPMPALNRQSSRIKKGEAGTGRERLQTAAKKKCGVKDKSSPKSKGFCRSFFISFMSTCRECHALNPSRRELVLLEETIDYFQ